ncbi:MAG: hypothetical protein JNK16_10755, partial [Phycisphaerales bacterium]|nr:hypothetical protein [Phycisphaerales bacterium]
ITGDGEIVVITNTQASPILFSNGVNATIAPGVTISYASNAGGTQADFWLLSGSKLTNQGVFRSNRSGATLTIEGAGEFINQGTLSAINGALRVMVSNWSNSGTIAIDHGTLSLFNVWSNTGQIRAENTSTANFQGSWSNNGGAISATGSTLSFAGVWTNAGLVTLTNSTWGVGGSSNSLGSFSRTGGSVVFTGVFNMPALVANDLTGAISVSGAKFTGTTFSSQGSGSFGSFSATLDNCTLATDITGTLTIQNNLTFANSARLKLTGPSNTVGMSFSLGAHTLSGIGTISMASGGIGDSLASDVTITSGIALEIAPEATAVTIRSGSSLTIQSPITVPSGKTLTITGDAFASQAPISATGANLIIQAQSWSNQSSITAIDSTLTFNGTWTNLGSISLQNSTWNLRGIYSGLGNYTNTGGTISYGGTFTGSSLVANAQTGDFLLSNITLQNTALSSADGAKFILAGAVTLKDCSLAVDLSVDPCVTLKIDHDLALAGADITVRSSASCPIPSLQFLGGTQTVSGSGSIILNPDSFTGSATPMSLASGTQLTLESGISLVRGTDGTSTVSLGTPSSLICEGEINADGNLIFSGGSVFSPGAINLGSAELSFSNLLGSLGEITIAPNARLTLAGNYSIDHPIDVPANARLILQGTSSITRPLSFATGAYLTLSGLSTLDSDITSNGAIISLSGNWSNSAAITATGGTLTFGGTWSNNGTFDVSNAQWTIGGTYPTLGAIQSSGNTLFFRDTYPDPILLADASTGEITLDQITMSGVTLRTRDGARIRVRSTITLDTGTIDGLVYFTSCGNATLSSGLALAPGSRIEIDSSNCSSQHALQFVGGTHTISGSGEIVAIRSGILRARANASVTIGSGIQISTQGGSGSSQIMIEPGSSLTNLGVLSSRMTGRSLSVTGSFKNQGLLESLAGTLSASGSPFTNQGFIKALGGSISLSALQGNLGPVEITAPGSVSVSGTSYTVDQPISVASGARLTLGGTYSVSALLESTGGDLSLSGNYTLGQNLSVVGGKLTLDGTWTNTQTVLVRNATFTLAGSWSNAGTFDVASSAWTIGGTYTSLGNTIASGNTLTYGGTFPGNFLRADASTGDITLKGVTFNNATLQCADGAKFRTAFASSLTTLNACTIHGEFVVQNCTSINVSGGLTLVDGSRLVLNNPFCTGSISFTTTAPQSVLGNGEIVLQGVGTGQAIQSTSSSLTFGPGITLRCPPDAQGHTEFNFGFSSGRSFTIAGLFSFERPGGTLTFFGQGPFTNTGTVRVTAGSLVLSAPITNVSFSGPSTTLTGGKWHAVGGKLSLSGSPSVIGPTAEVIIQGGSVNGFTLLRENQGSLTLSGGAFNYSLKNRGKLELGPGAVLSSSVITFEPTSTLTIAAKGTAPGDFPRVQTTTVVGQQGALRVRFDAPYIPQAGDVIGPVFVSNVFYYGFSPVCTDANPQNLGASLITNLSGSPGEMSLLVSPDTGLSPFITQQPANTSASPSAVFSVAAAPLDLAVLWRKDGLALTDGPTGHGSTISGSGDFTLTIANATPDDIGLYDAVLSNSCGTLLSNPALLRLCPGDLNSDGLVDDSDFLIFLASYNILDCSYPSMPALCPGDLNQDSLVDDAD